MQSLLSHDATPLKAHAAYVRYASDLQSAVLLLMRLSLGYVLALSGFRHLTHVDKTVEAFTSWGVPFPTFSVYISGITELAGGSLLILGLATRLISLPLVFNFIVAIVAASRGDIAKAAHTDGLLSGWETIVGDTAFPFLLLALVTLAFGPGKASIDYLLGRRFLCGAHPPTEPHGFPVMPVQPS